MKAPLDRTKASSTAVNRVLATDKDIRVWIAEVCHEANKAYCESLGDDSQVPWAEAPQWQKDSALVGVNLHMDNDVGPEASHISWMKQKINDGWKYGKTKNPEKFTHPCLVDFNKLPKEQQAKDFIFRSIVHTFKNKGK